MNFLFFKKKQKYFDDEKRQIYGISFMSKTMDIA